MYSANMVDTSKLALKVMNMQKDGSEISNPEEWANTLKEFYPLLEKTAYNINNVMYISFIQLLFPLNYFMDFIFTWKTKRKSSDLGVDFTNELILFINVIYWIYIWGFETQRDNDIPFQFDDMNFDQIYIT